MLWDGEDGGRSYRKRLKRMGEKSMPLGTQLGRFQLIEMVIVRHPERKFANH